MRIFYSQAASENLQQLWRLAKCLGKLAELVDVGQSSLPAALKSALTGRNAGWVLDVDSLKDGCDQEETEAVARLIRDHDGVVLLLVTSHGAATSRFLRSLTGGVVTAVTQLPGVTRVGFPESGGGLAGELSTQVYSRPARNALVLTLARDALVDRIMDLDASPALVHWSSGRARIFVWSTAKVFDVDRPLAREEEFEEFPDKYVPAIIFLRSAFADQCWHNPTLGAGLVIDDPLLRNNYGFINFPELLGSARRKGYHVTLAFIPWNERRSRPQDVRLFRDHADCFSICAHGCDHTNKEFRSADYASLLRKNFVARERLDRHRERTGLAWQPLMVCPQGQYSLEAIRAFADSRQFSALVNSTYQPQDLATPQLCGMDLLLPALDSFFGFPIFKRHYWGGDLAAFAMDLFLGKPAILVAHHDFFREGLEDAEAFASGLAKLSPDLEWTSLAETVSRTHWRRRVTGGRQEVRFFTDSFRLEHVGMQPVEYRLTRRIPAATNVRSVTVNGGEVPFRRENGMIVFQVWANRPKWLEIRVVVRPVEATKPYPADLKYQTAVALRRGLSELRDNLMARNRVMLKASTALAKALKQTGDS